MRDQYKALMLASFKDAVDLVVEFNEWREGEFPEVPAVPPQAVPRVAMMLYQSRSMETMSGSGSFDVPDFDDKMYE